MRRARLGRTVMAMGLPVKETYYMSKRDLLHEQKRDLLPVVRSKHHLALGLPIIIIGKCDSIKRDLV